MPSPSPVSSDVAAARSRWPALIALLVLVACLALPPIAALVQGRFGDVKGVGACGADERDYHLPQIGYFIEHPFHFAPYPSKVAMGPGHHILMATVARGLGTTSGTPLLATLHSVQLLLGLLFVAGAWFLCHPKNGRNPWQTTLILLPFALTPYVLNESVWIVTNAPTYALTFFALFAIRDEEGMLSPRRFWIAGLLTAIAIYWRQNTIWMVVPIAFAIAQGLWRRDVPPTTAIGAAPPSGDRATQAQARTRAIASLPGLLLPCLALLSLIALWHGLIPPDCHEAHVKGFNPAALLYTFGLTAVFAPFFWGYGKTELKEQFEGAGQHPVALAGVLGLILALAFPSVYDHDAGRFGGALWTLTQHVPAIAGRSLLFIVLTPIGAGMTVALVRLALGRGLTTLTVAMGAWLLVSGMNNIIYHRYYEVMILLFLCAIAAHAPRAEKRAWLGPVLLALPLLGLYVYQFFHNLS